MQIEATNKKHDLVDVEVLKAFPPYRVGERIGIHKSLVDSYTSGRSPLCKLAPPRKEVPKKEHVEDYADVMFLRSYRNYHVDEKTGEGDKAGFPEWYAKDLQEYGIAKIVKTYKKATSLAPAPKHKLQLPTGMHEAVSDLVDEVLDKKLDEKLAPILKALEAKKGTK